MFLVLLFDDDSLSSIWVDEDLLLNLDIASHAESSHIVMMVVVAFLDNDLLLTKLVHLDGLLDLVVVVVGVHVEAASFLDGDLLVSELVELDSFLDSLLVHERIDKLVLLVVVLVAFLDDEFFLTELVDLEGFLNEVVVVHGVVVVQVLLLELNLLVAEVSVHVELLLLLLELVLVVVTVHIELLLVAHDIDVHLEITAHKEGREFVGDICGLEVEGTTSLMLVVDCDPVIQGAVLFDKLANSELSGGNDGVATE
jgi:hypothetical protein